VLLPQTPQQCTQQLTTQSFCYKNKNEKKKKIIIRKCIISFKLSTHQDMASLQKRGKKLTFSPRTLCHPTNSWQKDELLPTLLSVGLRLLAKSAGLPQHRLLG
jgi:hypothetical protein